MRTGKNQGSHREACPTEQRSRPAIRACTCTIKQGDIQSVAVSLDRGNYFNRDVMPAIGASWEINAEPTRVVVRGNEAPDVGIRISAARDANLGEYKVYVKGTPETGESTSTEITVKVVAP